MARNFVVSIEEFGEYRLATMPFRRAESKDLLDKDMRLYSEDYRFQRLFYVQEQRRAIGLSDNGEDIVDQAKYDKFVAERCGAQA